MNGGVQILLIVGALVLARLLYILFKDDVKSVRKTIKRDRMIRKFIEEDERRK